MKGAHREHAWVVTRDYDGWTTHWDPVTLKKYATPCRWGIESRQPAEVDEKIERDVT